ncbi:MAG: glycosyltransferase [Gemmataceae bacterium]
MPSDPLVSVVVPCCGQLELTRLCVPSLIRHTRQSFEIIAIDAGSLDGTAEYWLGVQASASVRVDLVRAPSDEELPTALAQGLGHANGEFIALLNNDTVVPDGWLMQLVSLIGTNPSLAMVAPMTTYGPGGQVVWPVTYQLGADSSRAFDHAAIQERIKAVNSFAIEWRERNRGKWSEEERLGGGCVLIRKSALNTIGPIQGAPLHFFDPEAISRKCREAGYKLACCRDLFVHSFGSRGFHGLADSAHLKASK